MTTEVEWSSLLHLLGIEGNVRKNNKDEYYINRIYEEDTCKS